jgi:hypothetical protein
MTMNTSHKNLTRRYLIWAYKTTKESFERIERKTTQLAVDEYLLTSLIKLPKPLGVSKGEYDKLVKEFEQYIQQKRKDEIEQKYGDSQKKTLNPHYVYLKNRLASIEGAIKHFLGPNELKKIEALFEAEFTQRILQAKEHH